MQWMPPFSIPINESSLAIITRGFEWAFLNRSLCGIFDLKCSRIGMTCADKRFVCEKNLCLSVKP